jgi:hypothetical protein
VVLFFVFNALIFTIVSSLYTMINYCPDWKPSILIMNNIIFLL